VSDQLSVKQALWDGVKAQNRIDRKAGRGVATTVATVRKKNVCKCGHTAKHHKKTGRCRGKILTVQQTYNRKVAGAFGVPARFVNVPASCPCDAGVRE
jgi:hypothetical protein